MKIAQKLELKLENYEKCSISLDQDCPLGQLYDYTCAIQSFVMQKMKEAEELKNNIQPHLEAPEAQAQVN
jgi:hypothetical protein